MAIERLEAHHIELIHRIFHDSQYGEGASPTNKAALDQVLNVVMLPDNQRVHSCTRLAALYAVELFRARPWGQQTADTAMVTALVLMRLCGADIEAGENHDLYDHLRLQPAIWDYERTLQSYVTRTAWSDTVCRDAFDTEQNIGGLNSPLMLTRIRQEVIDIARNYLINPLHGYERPPLTSPTTDEMMEQDRRELIGRCEAWEYAREHRRLSR